MSCWSMSHGSLLSCCLLETKSSANQDTVTHICGPEQRGRHTCFDNQLQESLVMTQWIMTRGIFLILSLYFKCFYVCVSFSCFFVFSLQSLLCAGLHLTTRLKKWWCWSWAMLTPTCSSWWDSWKDSTAQWRSTRTPSKYNVVSPLYHIGLFRAFG